MLSSHQHLSPLETLAFKIGAVSVKILVAETQTFFIAQFENTQVSKPNASSAQSPQVAPNRSTQVLALQKPVKPNTSSATIEDELETAYAEHSAAPPKYNVGGLRPSKIDLDTDLEIAYLLIPKLDAIRHNLIRVQALLARIESQTTIYQPGIRRLCGEADYHLAVNLGTIRSTIEEARHHRPSQTKEIIPAWW